jgi:hypothetical protein
LKHQKSVLQTDVNKTKLLEDVVAKTHKKRGSCLSSTFGKKSTTNIIPGITEIAMFDTHHTMRKQAGYTANAYLSIAENNNHLVV